MQIRATARLTVAAAVVATAVGIVAPSAAFAVKRSATTGASCFYDGAGQVDASGLPTDQVVNFQLTDASGTTSWALGTPWDGKAYVKVPAPTSPTTYQFISKTWGTDGSKYNVFASCTA